MTFQSSAFQSAFTTERPEIGQLKAHGWTPEQAQGLIASLNLDGGTTNWKPEHLQKLNDWCSAHEHDPTTPKGLLEFISYELRNSYEKVGMELDKAKTVQQAQDAIEPYARVLCAAQQSGPAPLAIHMQGSGTGPNHPLEGDPPTDGYIRNEPWRGTVPGGTDEHRCGAAQTSTYQRAVSSSLAASVPVIHYQRHARREAPENNGFATGSAPLR